MKVLSLIPMYGDRDRRVLMSKTKQRNNDSLITRIRGGAFPRGKSGLQLRFVNKLATCGYHPV